MERGSIDFRYSAQLVRIIDGDTLVARIDLGFGVSVQQTLRLNRINAPEIRGENAAAGRRAALELLELVSPVGDDIPFTVQTLRDRKGKYGRYLAEITLADGTNVSDAMVSSCNAVYQDYRCEE